jgi:type IV pilus assembly protein PilB
VTGRKKLGELLVAAGVLEEKHLATALAEQRKWGGRLGRTLVELGFVDEMTMCAALSRQLQMPAIDLSSATLPPRVTDLLPVDLCERYGVMPVAGDRSRRILRVATSDPTNQDALREIGFRAGLKIEPMVAAPSDIDRAIRRFYYGEKPAVATVAAHEVPARPASAAVAPEPEPGEPANGVAESIAGIEQMLAAQMRALRVLVEILVEKGLLSREEYVARMKTTKDPG